MKEEILDGHMTIGDRVRQLRTERGWSLEELARRVGVGKNAVWELETNRRHQVRQENLRRYAECFGVSVEYLLTGLVADGQPLTFDAWLRASPEVRDEDLKETLRRSWQVAREVQRLRDETGELRVDEPGE